MISLCKKNKDMFLKCVELNNNLISKINLNQNMNTAKEYIAGGNMLFSKRPDVFARKMAKLLYEAKGCEISIFRRKRIY